MSTYTPKTALGRVVHEIEETLIAILLGLMAVITFANVLARYVFSDNILWALEMTGFLNAWMILLGISYAMKVGAHLGVDVLVNALPPPARKPVTLLAWVCTMTFAVLLFLGAWNYWAPFANLPPLWGSWFPQGFFEVEDTPMPTALQFFSDWLNEGDRYEKVPRAIPYAVLPISMALLILRMLQVGLMILRDERDMLIASHQVEAALDEVHEMRGEKV